MKEHSLVSNYTVAQYKVVRSKCNEEEIANLLDREFGNRDYLRGDSKRSDICEGRKILELYISDHRLK